MSTNRLLFPANARDKIRRSVDVLAEGAQMAQLTA